MIEILQLEFMQRALIAGVMIGMITGFLGALVIQRKMSFLGSGISHAAFGGVALALLLDVEPMLIAIPFTILIAYLIILLKNRTNLGSDTAIGILFSLAMACGVIFLALKEGYTSDAYSYLFGSILSVFPIDIYITLAMFFLVGLSVVKYWGRWAYSTFDRELALSDGISVERDEYILTMMIALVIVVSIKIVGMLLVGAYLIVPAAAARLLSRTFIQMTIYSIAIGAISSAIGLYLSYLVDLPSGSIIILFQTFILLVFGIIAKLR